MIVTSVSYSRLRSFGNYENETIGATAQVDHRGSPEDTLAALVEWVDERSASMASIRDEDYERHVAAGITRREIEELRANLDEARAKWNAAREFLKVHGIDADRIDIPF